MMETFANYQGKRLGRKYEVVNQNYIYVKVASDKNFRESF